MRKQNSRKSNERKDNHPYCCRSGYRHRRQGAWDIVIEVSGGSPTQATGRSAFVTPGVLKRNGGNLTCSNFCHAFTMKDYKASAYFNFMWRMFYDNNNMFNFEGKTSGIKNFMTDTFLANKWLDVPTALLDLFFERVKVIYEQIDNNIEEINALTKQRDELLPLLLNGQASVNYHLSTQNCFKESTNSASISPIFSQNSA